MPGQVALDHFCPMRRAAVPDQGNRSRQVTTKLAQKGDQMGSADIFIVGEQFEKEIDPLPLRTERKGTDGRDAIALVPGPLNRRLASRRIGAPPSGRELKARLVFEDQMGVTLLGFFFGYDGSARCARGRLWPRGALGRGGGRVGWSSLIAA